MQLVLHNSMSEIRAFAEMKEKAALDAKVEVPVAESEVTRGDVSQVEAPSQMDIEGQESTQQLGNQAYREAIMKLVTAKR